MDLPTKSTLEVLERRKIYLLTKNQKNNKNDYVNAEIKSLERIINFTRLFLINFPNEQLEKMAAEYESNNRTETVEDEKEYEVMYFYEKEVTKNYKINISFIKQNEKNYILFEPKKYVKDKYKWEMRGKYRLTRAILEDILKKADEMEGNL